jgi:hypothetical protein
MNGCDSTVSGNWEMSSLQLGDASGQGEELELATALAAVVPDVDLEVPSNVTHGAWIGSLLAWLALGSLAVGLFTGDVTLLVESPAGSRYQEKSTRQRYRSVELPLAATVYSRSSGEDLLQGRGAGDGLRPQASPAVPSAPTLFVR